MIKQTLTLITFLCTLITNAQTVIYNDSFDSNNNEWNYESTDFSCIVKKGQLIIENTSENKTKWTLKDILDSADKVDFDIETEIEVVKSKKDNSSYGLVWSCYRNNKYYRVARLTQNLKTQLYYYNSKEFNYYKPWESNPIINKKKNTIKIEKRANISRFYINGKLINEYGSVAYYGSKMGFILDEQMKIAINYFKVTTYPKTTINVVDTYDPNLNIIKIESLSTDQEEVLPIVSADGNSMYLCVKDYDQNIDSSKDDIYLATRKSNGAWNPYTNVGRPLNNRDFNYVISVSPDNNTLLLGNKYSSDGLNPAGKGVSISNRTENGWEVPRAMTIENLVNDNNYSEYFLTNDKKHLILAVEGKNTNGKRDLYVSEATGPYSWSEPKNLGNVINSFETEAYPFLAADGKTLYFSSKGHPGYGGFDLFVSKRLDDSWTKWSKPQNLGNIINSVNGETSLFMAAKGDVIYVAKNSDIYEIKNTVKQDPVTLIKGKVYNAKTNEVISAEVTYNNLKTNKELGKAISNPKTGEYSIVLPYGVKYSFMGNKDGFYAQTQNVDLSNLTEYKEIEVDLYLNPIEKGQTIRLNNIFFESGKYSLLEESNGELEKLFKLLNDNNNINIEVSGHTDSVGSNENNLTLSHNRANAVMNYLIGKGIAKNRITAKGYGETKPVSTNDTEKGKQLNRRVEFEIIKL